jgi:hypothetical protein
MQIGPSFQVNEIKATLMKQGEKSSVMKSADSAANRTGRWSTAKQDFAHRVTTSGSYVIKTTVPGKSVYTSTLHTSGTKKK